VWGNPARLHGFVSPVGNKLLEKSRTDSTVITIDPDNKDEYEIPLKDWEMVR